MLKASKISMQEDLELLIIIIKKSFVVIQGVSSHAPLVFLIMLECQLYIDPSSSVRSDVQAYQGLYYIFGHVL